MRKSLVLVLALLMVAGFYGVSFAGISTSPHDVVSWTGSAAHGARINTGVCSYCHIPHSAKGDRLFPTNAASDTAGINKDWIGVVAYLCAQCHSSLDNDFNFAHIDASNEKIFRALRSPDRATNDSATYDTHPTRYTNLYATVNALGIPEDTDTTVYSDKWPYMRDWKARTKDIECTSCHNPHDWNQTNRRNYLRVSFFDSGAVEGDSTAATRNVCSFCHTGRDASGVGLSNPGTHPVGNIVADSTTWQTNGSYTGIWFDTLGLETTTSRFFRKYLDTTGAGTNKSGRAVGDRGAHLGPRGEFTCQSCHIPHGAPGSRDGVVDLTGSYTNETAGLVAGPLLVKNNDISGFDAVSGFAGTGLNGAHWLGETAFSISGGESNLCEWCHGITPKKTDAGNEGDSTVAMAKYAHPVNAYPTSTADNTTRAYISNLSGESYSTVQIGLRIRYPVRADSTSVAWVNYEESGNANDPNNTAGAARGTGASLICMSCHDAHIAQAGTPILRGPSSAEYCEDCHYQNPLPAGASHPVKRMKAINCDKTTEDGGTLPNYANLYFETSAPIGSAVGGEVVCRTCHGGPFQTGVIHGGFGRFMLADYITFAELCVNCHGYDAHAADTVYSAGRLDTLRVGTAADKSANPSYYYTEGPSPSFLDNVDSGSVLRRVGSHYIGQITGNRPALGNATYGWLGSSDTTLDHLGSIENTADVDNWLDTTWFAALSTGVRRIWDTGTDGVGVAQYSIIGYLYDSVSRPVLTCLSCHTPHGAAAGTANGGPADDTTENSNWDGELLLAKNIGSYICYTCHLPSATHPVDYPDNTTHVGHKTDTSNVKNPGNRHDWVTRTDTTININDTTDPNKVVRPVLALIKPANYPNNKVICESCHSAHSANSRWGSYILEGDTVLAPNLNSEQYDSCWTTAALGGDVGKHNKRPVGDKSLAADTSKSVNDRPTCEMCHPQGTE